MRPVSGSLRDVSIEGWLAAFLFTVVVILLGAQVTLRYGFNTNVSWLEELVRFSFVWSVYFSFLVAAYENRHIRIALHIKYLPSLYQKIALTVADSVWIFFNALMIYHGTLYILSMVQSPYTSPTLGINIAYVQMIVPIGFAVLTVRVIQNLFFLWRGEIEVRDSRMDT